MKPVERSPFYTPEAFWKDSQYEHAKKFFEVGTDESLFDGLYISGNKELCDKYMGKYPVIFCHSRVLRDVHLMMQDI